ncbi:hypothetical protein Poli38472_013494 [Pythium oligandrum]|uniref:Formin-like protein n=1 Tax=Pythium oligandrum TaxID=41045 RepID=A0A8K1FC78_PYTOL|nr:hypothetical protein Poli38472_013494 [Pythium oligandrum]|eukprot:TMW58020.1 hypothetical protein Poli38472_013494 [Pythium oligandrum]
MWRRRGSIGGGSSATTRQSESSLSTSTQSNSITGYPSMTTRNSFFGSDPSATDRPLVFSVDVPTPGPLGLDLRARHVERDKPQRGAVVKGFRPLQNGKRGYVEQTGRVKVGDILQIIHQTFIDDMPFDQIVKHAIQLQQEPSAWPLRLEFRRERVEFDDREDVRPRRSSFFRSSVTSVTSMMNPVQDSTSFNEKLQYFRGFFANRIPTGGAAPKAKEVPPIPAQETVDEMYRELLVKRGVPDDVMDELVRIEPQENKWQVVYFAQRHEIDGPGQVNVAAEAARLAENLVELKWDNRGLKDLEILRNKIASGSAEWTEAFLEHFGLDYLTMKLPDPSPFPIEQHKYEKATRICDVILRILRSITPFTAGVEEITNVPGLVKRVALCFHTENGDLKKHTLQLLGIVCYNSAAGHQAVIQAFDYYKDVKGETIRFSCLRDALKSTRYSLAFKEDVLSFVNIIVNKAIRLEDRLAIRADFIALKMAGYFEEIRAKSQAVQRQKFPAFGGGNESAATSPSMSTDTATASPTSPIIEPRIVPEHPISAALKGRLEESLRRGGSISYDDDDVSLTRNRSKSRSAPSSPRARGRSLSDFSRDSFSSRPSFTDDVFYDRSRSSITTNATQLRTQLDNMEKQIEVFERFMEDDRKDTIYEQTDLSSIESVFKTLVENVSTDSELQPCLLSILQQLLFIPGDRAIGKEMWALAERLMKQVGLLAPVEEVRNYELGYDDRKTLLRLRDKYTEFLQKCADEDPTFHFHVGPIILIENRKPEDAFEDDVHPGLTMAQDHPELAKYFKLLRMGMPLEHVQQKMRSELTYFEVEILETPEKMIALTKETNETAEPPAKKGILAEEHEKFAKFFKLKKMGMPMPHIQLKMQAEGLNEKILETPDLLLDEEGNEVKEDAPAEAGGIPVKEHEKFAKYFKLLKMGMPMEHVKLKASADGLDGALLEAPDTLLDDEGRVFVPGGNAGPKGIPVKDHEKFAKFFKLKKMGMPLEQIKLKASAEGLDAELLDTPDALLNEDGTRFVESGAAPVIQGTPAKEHEKYAKFFKLMKMGMPLDHIKLKVSSEGLNPDMLDTPDKLLDADGNEAKAATEGPKGTPAKEHEKYAKFFKLLKMGMLLEHIKLKVSSEGLNPDMLDTPDKLLDEAGNEVKEPVKGTPVKDHAKFAKFFKLMKMGMPAEQVKMKASAEGLDGSLLDTPDKLVDDEGKEIKEAGRDVKASEHPLYAKYFKLMKMGMPRPQLELKMAAEGLDTKLLDTPDAMIPENGGVSDPAAPKKPTGPPPPPKPKLRNLYWEAVKEESTTGTIWEEFAEPEKKEESSAPAHPLFGQIAAKKKPKDKILDEYVGNLTQIFATKPAKAKEEEGGKKKKLKERAPTRVALIDVKRANNIGIMLARFRLPYPKIRAAILEVDKDLLSSEKLSALIQFAPEDAELEAVRAYTGDPKLLGDAEQYFRVILDVPRLPTRLQAIQATWQFDTYVEEQNKLMVSVRDACTELKQCSRLREIFKVVLSLGNALNDGTARGGAKGFRLNILLKLNQVKASDNSTTLLNYAAQLLRAKDPAIINFDEELPSIESASRITVQVLKAGESAVRKAATLICDELDEHAKIVKPKKTEEEGEEGAEKEKEDKPPVSGEVEDRFQEAIRPFAERAKDTSDRIQTELEDMMKGFSETVSFYGEDASSPECGPDSFFSIFYSFAKLLQTADRDNERKRITEERRIRREEETKKRLEMLKNKKKNTSFASLKDGDVDDIMQKIRAKRVAEKRLELLETGHDGLSSGPRSSSRSNLLTTPRSGSSRVSSEKKPLPATAVEVV